MVILDRTLPSSLESLLKLSISRTQALNRVSITQLKTGFSTLTPIFEPRLSISGLSNVVFAGFKLNQSSCVWLSYLEELGLLGITLLSAKRSQVTIGIPFLPLAHLNGLIENIRSFW